MWNSLCATRVSCITDVNFQCITKKQLHREFTAGLRGLGVPDYPDAPPPPPSFASNSSAQFLHFGQHLIFPATALATFAFPAAQSGAAGECD